MSPPPAAAVMAVTGRQLEPLALAALPSRASLARPELAVLVRRRSGAGVLARAEQSSQGQPMEISWTGPFQIQTYLDNAISRDPAWRDRWPPERDAVYLVSEREWNGQPDETAHILYVGGNTGESSRFVTRIGDLLADMFGFFGEETGHHSGGQTLWRWCDHHGFPPTKLWLGWGTSDCPRCAEKFLYDKFPKAARNAFDEKGLRNKVSPPACSKH